MISEPTYLAAKIISGSIKQHFDMHLQSARQAGAYKLAHELTEPVIEAIIDAGFWASLRREEGQSPKISLALVKPQDVELPLVFKNRIRLTPANLTKLAPAVERPGIHLGIGCDDDGLYVWGTTLALPGICFVLEVVEPGLLVIKHSRVDGYGKFINVAVLRGDQIKIVDEQNAGLTDCPALLTSLLGMSLPKFLDDSVNVLVELAASMREHGHGGLLLVVPKQNAGWMQSVIHPINYPVVPSFCGLSNLMMQDAVERSKPDWQENFRKAVEIVGGVTAVDGATVITDNYELLAFGAKVSRAENSLPVDQIIMTEPIEGASAQVIHPAQKGGTRHLAAAQFVYDQQDALALVASQDGHFTIFSWSAQLQMVHAHSIDALLL